jgi:alpha-tubulin suppressor-like RCC1 family protein
MEKGARGHRARLAAGDSHTCAILDDGTVNCWGNNNRGQLGNGIPANSASPVAVVYLQGVVSLAAAGDYTCVILSNSGSVSCWGDNSSGQLGVVSTPDLLLFPTTIPNLGNVVALAAGGTYFFSHTCAVRVDGTVWCWGRNQEGQLGIGSRGPNVYHPVQVADIGGAVAVAAGIYHTCALLANGTVQCWGDNFFGELGNGTMTSSNLPVPTVPLSATPGVVAVDISAGGTSTCARLSDGSVSCWGTNGTGNFGNGTFNNSSVPVPSQVSPTVAALSAGNGLACAILVVGTVSCWGEDGFGQLGDGGATNQPLPGPPVPGIANAVEIAAGGDHTCAMIVDGTIHCWGDNRYGQHGDGSTSPAGTDSVIGIQGTFLGRGVTAGNRFTCGRRGTGGAACWGKNDSDQLGTGATSGLFANPVAVSGLTAVVGMAAGRVSHSCAVDATGTATCWGSNSRGQLGNGTTIDSNQAAKVISGPGVLSYIAVAAGDSHSCGLTISGVVGCWGANDRGQLGNSGPDTPASMPVGGIANAIVIAAGSAFNCALIADGTIRCWGDDSSDQLGDGGAVGFSATPKLVSGNNYVAIAAGSNHMCAINASGAVICWGANSRGQIGNNSTVTAAALATVQGLTDAVSISAGAFYTCAVRAGGGASCWGANDAGELGAIDSLEHLTPTPVEQTVQHLLFGSTLASPLTNVVAITTGTGTGPLYLLYPTPHIQSGEQTCALLASGVVECWGDNSFGEIGDGTQVARPRPTVVNSFAANVDPAAKLRNGRVAEVTALVDCETGARAHIILTLDQGASSGAGQADTACEGRLIRVPMTVPAQGPNGFSPGAATARVEAIVSEQGSVLADTHWTKQVVLSAQ